jgi:tetratricopeptide (TPR) repeat protein
VIRKLKIYIDLDDIKEATAYSKPLLAFYEKQGFHESIAQIKLDIAQYWAAQQEYEKAKKIAKEAQDNFRQSGGDPKQFEPYMNALKTNHLHTHTIDASRVSLMIFTVVVLLLIFGVSYFYARRRVAKMA